MKHATKSSIETNHASLTWRVIVILLAILVPLVASPNSLTLCKWSVALWLPAPLQFLVKTWRQEAWNHWKSSRNQTRTSSVILELPTVIVSDHGSPEMLLQHLDETYGKDWRKRPLHFKELWTQTELKGANRRLNRNGLLEEPLKVPYFTDARTDGALTPDGLAPVAVIVANISYHGAPHKIGSQLVFQTYPELVEEVAPPDLIKLLFGDRFRPKDIQSGAFGIPFLPALTTVPLFVAGTTTSTRSTIKEKNDTNAGPDEVLRRSAPFTGLHCEPIANLAVQLEGEKQWTLVSPEYTLDVRPDGSPDGRAFFVSKLTPQELTSVPQYQTTTAAGDAIWIPTWTWHQVEYKIMESSPSGDTNLKGSENKETTDQDSSGETFPLAIGASLFHLRPMDLIQNNPLLAVLVIPNLVLEVLQFNTQ